MTTAGERVQQERLRQKLTRKQLGLIIGLSDKTVQRIEQGVRDQYLFLAEEALGLAPSGKSGDEPDEDAVLRAVSDRKFWLEAARRAIAAADNQSSDTASVSTQPARGRAGTAPTSLTEPQQGEQVKIER